MGQSPHKLRKAGDEHNGAKREAQLEARAIQGGAAARDSEADCREAATHERTGLEEAGKGG